LDIVGRMTGLVRWLGVVALVVCASPAVAQEAPVPPEARASFERGEQHCSPLPEARSGFR
jgi:hypothetical protein